MRVRYPIVIIFLFASSVFADPLGDGFIYQGELEYLGGPANDVFDFRFSLYDIELSGSIITTPSTVSDVAVGNGIFTVELDFGSAPFETGNQLWLEIETRIAAGAGPWTKLDPRQKITAPPYSKPVITGDNTHSFRTNNTAVGENALVNVFAGASNSAFGHQAMMSTTDGNDNSALGHNSLRSNLTGGLNVAVGVSALEQNITGNSNVAIGTRALKWNVAGNNVAIGQSALEEVDGSWNVGIGSGTGEGLISGINNLYLGTGSGPIGFVSESYVTRIGGPAQTDTYIYGISSGFSPEAEIRQVYVDSKGKLVTRNATGFWYSISALSLTHPNFVRHVGFGEAYLAVGTPQAWATAPVHLPDGALITLLVCRYKDNDVTGVVDVTLNRHVDRSETTIAQVASTEAFALNDVTSTTAIVDPPEKVDNRSNYYYLSVRLKGVQSPELAIYGCKIQMTQDSDAPP